MNIYKLTLLEKDEVHIPAIKEYAIKYGSILSFIKTKDGTVFEFDFATYAHLEKFKEVLETLTPKLF